MVVSCDKDDPDDILLASCSDGILNGLETGIDCGGDCSPCTTCNDNIQNGNETGVDCGGDCPACLSSQNEIISLTFADSPGDFDPIVQIDNSINEVYIRIGKVFPTSDITNLSFNLELSAGAEVPNLPSDFSNPRTIDIVAEDGTIRSYKFIVSGAYGSLIKQREGASSSEETRAIYQLARVSESNKVYITLESDPDIVSNFFYYRFFIGLDGVSLDESLVGEYDLEKWLTNSPHSCSFAFPDNGSTATVTTPRGGYLKITKHDMENKLISGQVLELKYGSLGNWEEYFPYAEFVNIRYE